MQVRKFEAKNMAEALKMVKDNLGPDAIILSAKENKKGYGIGGGASVELTAAISETKLQERQYALKKMREQEREKLLQSSAKQQKHYVEKSVGRYYQEKNQEMVRSAHLGRPQYISIADEEIVSPANQYTNEERIKKATKSAMDVFANDFKENAAVAKAASNKEIAVLQKEIQRLQGMIHNFEKVPQNFISSHPGAEFSLPYEVSFMFEKLVDSGMKKEDAAEILHKARESLSPTQLNKKGIVEGWTAKYLLENSKVVGENTKTRVEVFIGGCGSGKTSSLVKYASHQIIPKRKSVALITTDTYKVGASEQLKIYAKILNVPFAIVNTLEEWQHVSSKLNDIDLILVDTPGFSLKDLNEIDIIKNLVQMFSTNARVHYVSSSAVSTSSAIDLAKRFRVFNYHDLIFTKLDESSNHGSIYSISKELALPIHSFGIGTKVPEDFEFATRERVLDLIFKITKRGL